MGLKGGIDATDVLGAMGATLGAAGLGVIWCVSISPCSFYAGPCSLRREALGRRGGCQDRRARNFRALLLNLCPAPLSLSGVLLPRMPQYNGKGAEQATRLPAAVVQSPRTHATPLL